MFLIIQPNCANKSKFDKIRLGNIEKIDTEICCILSFQRECYVQVKIPNERYTTGGHSPDWLFTRAVRGGHFFHQQGGYLSFLAEGDF